MMDRPRSVSLIDGGWVEKARGEQVSDPRWNLQDFADRLVPKHHWRFRTYYFDALPFKYREKEIQLQSIDRLERFTVRKGYCKQTSVKGYLKGGGYQAAMTEVVTIE